MVLPSRMMVTASATLRISLSLWLMMMLVTPWPFRWRIRSSRWPESSSLSAAVGSSRISSFTSLESALAISTSCCLPTLMCWTGVTGFSLEAHAGQQLCCFQVGLPPVHPAVVGLFVAQVDVLGDGQVRAQRQFLVDDHDAALLAVRDAGEIAGFVFEEDVAVEGVVRIDAGQHFHEGGFPGAVFTADGVDLTAVHVQGDVLQGFHAGEGLGDSSHLKNGCVHRQFPLTGRSLAFLLLQEVAGRAVAGSGRRPQPLADYLTSDSL